MFVSPRNSYCWLNPTRLPLVESLGLILVILMMAVAFHNGSMALSFPHWDGNLLQLQHATTEIQTPQGSELFYP